MRNVCCPQKIIQSLFLFTLVFTASSSFAGYEWIVIDSGSFGGSGFDRDKETAHEECEADMEERYHQLAVECCEGDPDSDYPMYTGRCAVDNRTGKNSRSFFGGSGSYFCWPRYTETQMATGYWLVTAGTTEYSCKELVNTRHTYTPTVEEALSDLTPPSYVDRELVEDPISIGSSPSTGEEFEPEVLEHNAESVWEEGRADRYNLVESSFF